MRVHQVALSHRYSVLRKPPRNMQEIMKSEQSVTPVSISYNWEDYAGNLDALVYGLLMNKLLKTGLK